MRCLPSDWLLTGVVLALALVLREEEAGEDLLAGVLVVVGLEVEHGLGLVLGEPQRLQVEVGEGEGEVRQAVARDVEHVQLLAGADLVGQRAQLVLPQREDAQVDEAAHLGRQRLQPVAVDVEVGQARQVPDAGRQRGDVVLGQHQLLQAGASETQRETEKEGLFQSGLGLKAQNVGDTISKDVYIHMGKRQ